MTTLNAHLLFEAGGSAITVIKEHNSNLYFAMQQGLIYQNNVGLFLNIQNRVYFIAGSEIGLLGLTFDPTNALRFFLWYTESPNIPPVGFDHINRLEEWQIIGGIPQSTTILLRLPNPAPNHNGLNNIFYDTSINQLILATGDGGNPALSQNNNSLNGKLISFDVDNVIWQTMQNTNPITQVSQLGVFSSVITVISKGIRNPTRNDKKSVAGVGVNFLSSAGESTREFAFCFTTYNKNFGWEPFEGPIPTVSGTTVLYPTEVIQLLALNQRWLPIVSYANNSASGLPAGVISGAACDGVDIYVSNNIPSLNNNLIILDLTTGLLNAPFPSFSTEALLEISQLVSKITVNGIPAGYYTSMYVTTSGLLLFVVNTTVSGELVTDVYYLTM